MGGGEDPEVLQEVPQEEISAEGVKKEGFHFDDYCNLDTKVSILMTTKMTIATLTRWGDNDGDLLLSESGHEGAMEEAH